MANNNGKGKSLESWIWDAACSIRRAKDAPKYKDFILPLIFTKRLCDVFDDEVNRIAAEVGSRKKAFQLVKADHKLVRFYLPLLPEDPEESVWSIIRKLSDKIGEGVTTHMRAIAKENPGLQGIIGKSYEYLIRKFAEGGGQSAGEFYTPPEVGTIMSKVLQPEPGMEIYDPTCGSGGLLIKCEIAREEAAKGKKRTVAPLKLYGQEYFADTLIGWKEEEKLSRIVDHAELAKNDYNISPSRYIHTSDAETYRPIAEIVEELNAIETEARETDRALQKILKQLRVGA